jgi:Family of unknown function (DUF6939)
MTIRVMPKWNRTKIEAPTYDVTSGGDWDVFSPFTLGPIPLYGGYRSLNMENGWQYSKIYAKHSDAGTYYEWAVAGWNNPRAVRYPMGKGAKPLCSMWDGYALDYINARKQIYIPLYTFAIRTYQFRRFWELKTIADAGDIVILDYDAYDHYSYGYSWDDVINDPTRKMGHGFVLAMMLEGRL